jgi:hypothetical protein
MALYCGVCENGLREFREVCDGPSGCESDCSGAKPGFVCTDAVLNTASVCTCEIGYIPDGFECISQCGDSLKVGTEACDDGGNGCLNDCTGPKPNFQCTGGSNTTASICTCITGYVI